MAVSFTTGDASLDTVDDPATRPIAADVSRRLQVTVAIVAAGWLAFMVVMLLRSSVPDLGPRMRFGRGPSGHLAMAAVLGFLTTTVMSFVKRWPPPTAAWYATVVTAMLVAVLEVAQIPVPIRAFEMDDLVYGVAGGVLGTAGAAGIIAVIGRRLLLHLVAVCGLAGLIVGVSIAIVVDSVARSS